MNYFANPYQGYGSPYGYPSAAPQGAAGAPQAFGGQVLPGSTAGTALTPSGWPPTAPSC